MVSSMPKLAHACHVYADNVRCKIKDKMKAVLKAADVFSVLHILWNCVMFETVLYVFFLVEKYQFMIIFSAKVNNVLWTGMKHNVMYNIPVFPVWIKSTLKTLTNQVTDSLVIVYSDQAVHICKGIQIIMIMICNMISDHILIIYIIRIINLIILIVLTIYTQNWHNITLYFNA